MSSFRDAGVDEIEVIDASHGLQQLGFRTYQIGVGVKKGRQGRGRRRGGLIILKVQGACVWVSLCVYVGVCG